MQKLNLAVLALVGLASVSALAAPSTAKATAPGQSVGTTAEVSHKEMRSTNIRVSPLGIASGAVGLHVDLGVSDSITVGPTASHYTASVGINDFETKLSAWEFGVRANFYLGGDRFQSGWVFGPSVSYMPATLTQTDAGTETASASLSGVTAGALIGYQWVFDGGFNMNLGGGIAYYGIAGDATGQAADGTDVALATPAFSGILPNLELTVGYAF
jgi:hypothetical protein